MQTISRILRTLKLNHKDDDLHELYGTGTYIYVASHKHTKKTKTKKKQNKEKLYRNITQRELSTVNHTHKVHI